jgi:phosphopantothenoylcysteine decarboxylase/phosphopantothenate--cysteine ligase
MTEISPEPASRISGKRVVLGVSASIAAYKAAEIASALVKEGVDVYPVLTRDAARFIGPATFHALTGNPCPIDTFEEPYPGQIAHIFLAQSCDLFVIAPASMDVLAKLAHGFGSDMLTAAALATRAPILLAPAMNTAMWENPATQANIARLREFGYRFVEPVSGRLACRTEGVGKLADVEEILEAIRGYLGRARDLAGLTVLVTAGPTREPLDPVRFITNRSSGKMGYALAQAAADRGANVILVSGPTALPPPAGVEFVSAETAAQMQDAVLPRAPGADIIIQAAAIADYTPAEVAPQKVKKTGEPVTLTLTPTTDFSVLLGRDKRPGQILVGFAAETENVLDGARRKLATKNLDWIVANDVTAPGAGFDVDTNIVTLLSRAETIALPLLSKREVADRILDTVAAKFAK